ncbi:MAG: helix-turn-helix domain-containing protein, partial [Gammaproteobacteria bacterium]|nr:helix-turn-helix domain-containing protein [Gammaproteobacteria bacterium]
CNRKYTPQPKRKGYPESLHQQALQMYVDGLNLRRIGRHLGVHHTTVLLWVKAHAAGLPQPPRPEEIETAEMDELYSFIGSKKTESTS